MDANTLRNLGMGYSFAPQRADSTVVNNVDYSPFQGYDTFLSGWNQRYAAATAPVVMGTATGYNTTPSRSDLISQVVNQLSPIGVGWDGITQEGFGAKSGADPYGTAYRDLVVGQIGQDRYNQIQNAPDQGAKTPYQYSYQISGPSGVDPNALNAEKAAMDARKAQQDALTNQFVSANQAYSAQTGNGFAGGVVNGDYALPNSGLVTGYQPGMSGAPAGTPGATAGASNATPSTGLAPTGMAGAPAAASTGTNGWSGANAWGGVFSAKNPWSLS